MTLCSEAMARLQEDIRHLRFWRSVIAELLGTMFLVFVGCAAFTETDPTAGTPAPVKVGLAFGLMYIAVLYAVRNVGDGHMNPAVTVALLATRRFSVVRSLFFLAAQLLGAIIGAAFAFAVTASEYRVRPWGAGCTIPATHVSEGQAFGVEFFATFFFVFVVFSCYDKVKLDVATQAAPFVVGLTYGAVVMIAVPYSGGSANSARSFGPAVVNGIWHHHWVYWFGPLIGGVCGGGTYDLIFSTKSSFNRIKACFTVFHKREDTATGDIAMKDKDAEEGDVDETGEERKDAPAATDEMEELSETKQEPTEQKPRIKLFRPKLAGCCDRQTQ